MGSRTQETKTKDTIRGTRAELLNAITWAITYPKDRIEKSTEKDDWEKHIDWIVTKPNGVKITYDTKARRFEKYGNAFHPDLHFVAEIENRNPNNPKKSGSIYGKQGFMSLEVAGYFNYIQTKEIKEYVEEMVIPFNIPTKTMNGLFGAIYTFDDGAQITALAFNQFPKLHRLPIPAEFHARQFEYTTSELLAYIKQHNLNIKL